MNRLVEEAKVVSVKKRTAKKSYVDTTVNNVAQTLNVSRITFMFCDKPSYYDRHHGRRKTAMSGVVAESGFTLVQDYNLLKSDIIKGLINGKPVDITLDKKSRFQGTIGGSPVNMTLSSNGSIAILSGVFEDMTINIVIRRGWLGTSIKGTGINLELESGVFSFHETKDYKGTYNANIDLIPFIISIVQSIIEEENLYFAAA